MQDQKILCEFCKKEVEFNEVKFKHRTYRMSPKRCDCVQSIQFWQAEDEREAKEKERIEAEERKVYIERLFEESQLPSRWKDRTFERYTSDANKHALEISMNFVKSFNAERGNGLLFTGPVGLGKTHLVAAIAMELLSRQYHVMFGTVGTLLAQIRNTYEDKKLTEREVFNKLTHCHLLIIDDLGKEKVTDWVAQMVYEVINTRYDDNKSLIITTNMKLSQIKKKYNGENYDGCGDAIVSRIIEMCQGVQMEGKDYRKRNIQAKHDTKG